ncbi:hypothetical protein H0H92_005973, partial [Tricholoma furcatifolium]
MATQNNNQTLAAISITIKPSDEIVMADPDTSPPLEATQDKKPSNDDEALTLDPISTMVIKQVTIPDHDTHPNDEDIQNKLASTDDETMMSVQSTTQAHEAVLVSHFTAWSRQPTMQSRTRTPSRGKDRARPPRKRARRIEYDANDPRRFLDMEAEVSNDEEGDDNENASLGKFYDFINDDNSESDQDTPLPMIHSIDPMRFDEVDLGMHGSDDEWGSEEEMLDWYDDPATTSHNSVMQLMSTEEANQAWHFYLDEERRQAELEARDRERYPDDRHWYPDPVPDTVPQHLIPDSITPLLPRPSVEKHMWRVAVK